MSVDAVRPSSSSRWLASGGGAPLPPSGVGASAGRVRAAVPAPLDRGGRVGALAAERGSGLGASSLAGDEGRAGEGRVWVEVGPAPGRRLPRAPATRRVPSTALPVTS